VAHTLFSQFLVDNQRNIFLMSVSKRAKGITFAHGLPDERSMAGQAFAKRSASH
jgi:hypothetical protein